MYNYSDKYTAMAGLNGIHDLDDLKAYAQAVYPEGKDIPDNEQNSSIYKLIAYHILPCWLPYEQLNTSQPEIINNYMGVIGSNGMIIDPEDFFETLLPHWPS